MNAIFFLNITQCRKTRLILFPFWVHESEDTRENVHYRREYANGIQATFIIISNF